MNGTIHSPPSTKASFQAVSDVSLLRIFFTKNAAATLESCCRATSLGKSLGGLFTTSHDHLTSAHGLDDLVLREHGDCGINLWAVAIDHYHHRGRCEINGFATEVLGDLKRGRAVVLIAKKLDQNHFLGDGIVAGVLKAMDHIDQLIDLLDDLIETGGISGDTDGHARKRWVATLGNDQGIDIETTARKHLADSHQDTRLVVPKDGKCVAGAAMNWRDGSVGFGNHFEKI